MSTAVNEVLLNVLAFIYFQSDDQHNKMWLRVAAVALNTKRLLFKDSLSLEGKIR